MTNKERKIINAGIKILKREFPKKGRCTEAAFGCWTCHAYYIIEHVDSLVNFWLNIDEDDDKIASKRKPKKK